MKARWTIIDDGLPTKDGGRGISIVVNGEDVTSSVTGYSIQGDLNGTADLTLHVRATDVIILGDSDPTWTGLERVPDAALQQELQRRNRP